MTKEIEDMNTNINIEKLSNKISREYHFDTQMADAKAEELINMCPPSLHQNIIEWSEDALVTDIYIGNYSVPMILRIWKSCNFLRAVEVMTELYNGNTETAELKIWSMRR